MAIRQIGASQSTDPMQMLFLMMQMEENRADRRREERKFDLQMEQFRKQEEAENRKQKLLEFETLRKGIMEDESLSKDARQKALEKLYGDYDIPYYGTKSTQTTNQPDPGLIKKAGQKVKEGVDATFGEGTGDYVGDMIFSPYEFSKEMAEYAMGNFGAKANPIIDQLSNALKKGADQNKVISLIQKDPSRYGFSEDFSREDIRAIVENIAAGNVAKDGTLTLDVLPQPKGYVGDQGGNLDNLRESTDYEDPIKQNILNSLGPNL